MRKETARKIEIAFGKPEGWLDLADLIDPGFPPDDPGFDLVTRAWNIADEASRAVPLAWANAVLAASEKK
jgi:hypothetical protein